LPLPATQEEKTFSPLRTLLPEHVSPELLYLEVKWGSLMPYEASCWQHLMQQ
jgi:hypothetical protein